MPADPKVILRLTYLLRVVHDLDTITDRAANIS